MQGMEEPPPDVLRDALADREKRERRQNRAAGRILLAAMAAYRSNPDSLPPGLRSACADLEAEAAKEAERMARL